MAALRQARHEVLSNVRGPGNVDGVFDTFVSRAAPGMDTECPVGSLSLVLGYWELVVDVDVGDPDGVSDALYPALDSGYVVLR